MKKIYISIAILALIFCGVFAIYYFSSSPSMSNTIAKSEDKPKDISEEIAYQIIRKADYASCIPQDLYNQADLVIIGKYVKKNKSYVTDYSAIVTESNFEVSKVLKGEYSSKNINLEYYGGIVTVSEFAEKQTEAELQKMGISKSSISPQLAKAKVESTVEHSGVKVVNEKNYVIFLSYDKEKNKYFVLSDGYGVVELSQDNKMYNLDTKTFDTKVTELK